MGFFENLDAMFRRLTHTEKFDFDVRNIDKYEGIPNDYKEFWMKHNKKLDRKEKLEKLNKIRKGL